jgi:hypothetical protein
VARPRGRRPTLANRANFRVVETAAPGTKRQFTSTHQFGRIRRHSGHAAKPCDRRIGLAIRYVPTYVRQAVGANDSATLVRGVDNHKNFATEPRPRIDLDPEGVAFHKAATEAQAAVLYRGTGKTAFRA